MTCREEAGTRDTCVVFLEAEGIKQTGPLWKAANLSPALLILIRSNGPQDEKTGRGPRIQKTKGRPYGPAGFGIIPAITTKPNMVSLEKKQQHLFRNQGRDGN